MAHYIKKEIADLNGKGSTQACYRLKSLDTMSMEKFVERVHRFNGAFSTGVIIGVLTAVMEQLTMELGYGYKVQIDGLGTFGCRLGVREDKDMDGFEEGKPRLNAQSIEVKGVTFCADKSLVKAVARECHLERGGEERLRRSKYSLEERTERARQYLARKGFMHVGDYARLTGLSYTTASRELIRLAASPSTSGIRSKGVKSAKLYLPA